MTKKALAKMIIVDEFLFNIVEGVDFKDFWASGMPKFHGKRCVWYIFGIEIIIDESFITIYAKGIYSTIDLWTSCQTVDYICINAHHIDDDWNCKR